MELISGSLIKSNSVKHNNQGPDKVTHALGRLDCPWMQACFIEKCVNFLASRMWRFAVSKPPRGLHAVFDGLFHTDASWYQKHGVIHHPLLLPPRPPLSSNWHVTCRVVTSAWLSGINVFRTMLNKSNSVKHRMEGLNKVTRALGNPCTPYTMFDTMTCRGVFVRKAWIFRLLARGVLPFQNHLAADALLSLPHKHDTASPWCAAPYLHDLFNDTECRLALTHAIENTFFFFWFKEDAMYPFFSRRSTSCQTQVVKETSISINGRKA